MKKQGTLEFRDLGPGQWVLHTAAGEVSLFGELDPSQAGQQVEVEGEALDGASTGMVSAEAMMVQSVRTLR